MSLDEPSTVDHIVDELYSGLLDGEAWRRALIAAADMVGGSGVTVFASDPRTGQVLHDESHRMDPALVAEHRSGWDMRDPHFGLTPTAPVQVPAYESRLSRMHESRSTPHVLATWLHRAPDRVVLLTIHATRRRDPFDPADAQALQRVTRHIARALEIRNQLGLLNARMNALGQVLEHGHGCYLLLDARGAVVESSSAARSLLARENNSIACDADGQLSLSAPADRDFRQWISTGHAPTAASPGFLAVPRPDAGSPLRVMLAPLNHVPVAGMDNAPRWLLSIADPDLPADKPLRTLRNLFGLSEREAEIATLIASGMRPAAAAARMGIALNTARTHLKHVFQKSGAASQAELVRLVLRHSQGSSGV